jgi:phosphatidylserine/phosphatidylglycerophosphate/cardiolipin synthase-like enzyme
LARQDEEIARLETNGASHRKLMMLARRNSHSVLSRRNTAEIPQDAATFYPRLTRHRHSIHLQYFIWGADQFTERPKEILVARARAGVEVRLLYDPLGSQEHLSTAATRRYGARFRTDGAATRHPARAGGVRSALTAVRSYGERRRPKMGLELSILALQRRARFAA